MQSGLHGVVAFFDHRPERAYPLPMPDPNNRSHALEHPVEAASRGLPSYVWRAGQDRRFEMIRNFAALEGSRALDIGCGLGMYTRRLAEAGAQPLGLEIDWPRAREARASGLSIIAAVSEHLPLDLGSLDLLLMHEVLEHVADDRATAAELSRCLAPGGRAIIFVPNRWWPFETHGIFWGGRYRFGNIPMVNYLPDPLRNRLAPHVRAYTRRSLREAFHGLPMKVVHHSCIFPGYDNLAARRPRLGGMARRLSYALEKSPMERFGLSHLLVLERVADEVEAGAES